MGGMFCETMVKGRGWKENVSNERNRERGSEIAEKEGQRWPRMREVAVFVVAVVAA